MKELSLVGNDDLGKNLKYRGYVLFITRIFRGNNRVQGLVRLDGDIVTVEQRVAAMISFGKKKDAMKLR